MSPPPPQELLTTLEDFKEVNTSYKEKQTEICSVLMIGRQYFICVVFPRIDIKNPGSISCCHKVAGQYTEKLNIPEVSNFRSKTLQLSTLYETRIVRPTA